MIEAAVIGAGGRGNVYASYAEKRPNEVKIVAVAEPNEAKRKRFADRYGIPENRCFETWQDMMKEPQICRAAIICTQDQDHYDPTMKALAKGYDILLEKPMSNNPLESMMMAEEAERRGRVLTVCHSMRYSPYMRKVKELLDSGAVGKIMTIQWTENVGHWHQAHSFVRGHWRNSRLSSPMILAKSCHDMDILQWLIGAPCEKVSSFGALSHFTSENAPEGSTLRCTDGCAVESECPYSAIKWYYNEKKDWPHSITHEATLAARWEAIKHGPYGRCVYHCDNDVVDHQVVNMQFQGDITVSFTMTAFTELETRSFKIMGTEGEMRGFTKKREIEVHRFDGNHQIVKPAQVEGGHGGADTLLMRDFVKQLSENDTLGLSPGRVSAQNHLIAFAAEASRLSGETIDMKQYTEQVLAAESGTKSVTNT